MSKLADRKTKALADALEQIEIDKIFIQAKLDNEKDILTDRREITFAKAAKIREGNHERKDELRHTLKDAKVSRSIDEEIAKIRSEDHKDIMNYRNEHAKHVSVKEEEERLEILQNRQLDHASAKDGKFLEQLWKHSKEIEKRDIINFRREIAVHKENIQKEAKDTGKEQMASHRQVAIEDRKLDQATSVQKHNEHIDRMLFRRETAMNANEQSNNQKDLNRAMMKDRGQVAIQDRRIDDLLKLERIEEDRDIMNFRRELAEGKATKDIADAVEERNILISNGLIAQEYRKMDALLMKARQEENRDILHYRHYGSGSGADCVAECVPYYGMA